MNIGLLDLSFKLSKSELKQVINYFRQFGYNVIYYTHKSRKEINCDVLIFADGGFGCSGLDIYKKNSIFVVDRFVRRPEFAIGFSDATYYMSYLVDNGIPCFYGLNAIDFIDVPEYKNKYPDIINYCRCIIRNNFRKRTSIVGGNLTIFNLYISHRVSVFGSGYVLDSLYGRKLFFEDGGFSYIKGDGSFILDIELEKLRIMLGVSKLYDVFSGVLFGGMQEDRPEKNDYLSIPNVLKKHFGRLKIKTVNCNHDKKVLNDLVLLRNF